MVKDGVLTSGDTQPAAMPVLDTDRLLVQPLTIEDAPAIQACFPRWEIVRFLQAQIPWPYPSDGALAYLRDVALPAVREGRKWHWTIRRRADPATLLGLIGLKDAADDNRGFWLSPEAQGEGIMTEACTVVTDFWFDVLQRPLLRVAKAAANERSRALSRRMGMRCVGAVEKNYVSGRQPSELWETTAAEWRAFRQASGTG